MFMGSSCDAGMGKTIQAISLIVTHRNDDFAPVQRAAAAEPAKQQQQDAPRPKLRLGAAPPKPHIHDGDSAPCSLLPEADALAGAAAFLRLLQAHGIAY